MTHYLVKLAPSAIGVVDPCPYLWGFGPWPLWVATSRRAQRFASKEIARDICYRWGPDWREVVRVVRVGRGRG